MELPDDDKAEPYPESEASWERSLDIEDGLVADPLEAAEPMLELERKRLNPCFRRPAAV